MKWRNLLIGALAAFLLLLWRLTCRYRIIDDPRRTLRQAGRRYVFALLHAHQVSAIFANNEPVMSAMVSRSQDGDLLVPSLHLRRVIPVRGSTGSRERDKGGRRALGRQAELLRQGIPALLAVDGPQGPRNHVHRGIAELARDFEAVVLPVVAIPSRRFILRKTWDRLQIPMPFCRVEAHWGAPLDPSRFETPDQLRLAIEESLSQLEHVHDPCEAAIAAEHRENYERRRAQRRGRRSPCPRPAAHD